MSAVVFKCVKGRQTTSSHTFLNPVVWVEECEVAADEHGGVAAAELELNFKLSGKRPDLNTLKTLRISVNDCRSFVTSTAMKSLTEVFSHNATIEVASEITLVTSSLILVQIASVLMFSATYESWSKSLEIVSMRVSS